MPITVNIITKTMAVKMNRTFQPIVPPAPEEPKK